MIPPDKLHQLTKGNDDENLHSVLALWNEILQELPKKEVNTVFTP